MRSGRPRQLMEMNENSRCSTLFHLLVPGGKWLTRMAMPSLSGYGPVTDPDAVLSEQLCGQHVGALAGPAQRRLGVTSR
ncbi:MAG TPA: hypothetical protein VF469_36725, partial [Kofleriaceae bacterium]